MSLESEIIVVSGLPRSGTSLMMQMLSRGGIPVLTDAIRAADVDNPRGYLEFERVKQTKADASWLPFARGKAVKLVSSLLYDLPATERYRVIFMQRDLDEVISSQETMLLHLHRPSAPREQLKSSFTIHLQRLFAWLPAQNHLHVLKVSYNDLLANPGPTAQLLSGFLDGIPTTESMLAAIDPALYRNRSQAADQ